jgi:hypothetical protein
MSKKIKLFQILVKILEPLLLLVLMMKAFYLLIPVLDLHNDTTFFVIFLVTFPISVATMNLYHLLTRYIPQIIIKKIKEE